MSDQKTEQKPEHEKRIREALDDLDDVIFDETVVWTTNVTATDLRALLADLDAVRGALEECQRWHNCDKWRDGSPSQRAAWKKHRDMINAALKGATA